MDFVAVVFPLSSFCLHTHIVPYAADMGISTPAAGLVLGLIGGVTILGRLVIGMISDKSGRKVWAIMCGLLQVAAMVWLAWARGLWMFYIFAVVYGFASGGFDIPVTVQIGDIFGLHSPEEIMGVLIIGWGLGATIGHAVGALIYDFSKTFVMAFLIGAVGMLAATFLLPIISYEIRKPTHS